MSWTKAIGAALLLAICGGPARSQDKTPAKPKSAARVSSDLLEGVLKDLGLAFKKDAEKPTVHAYTFQRGDNRIRLVNYNGEDLWIEAIFDKKLTLAQANQWNATAKYTRCVLLDGEGKTSVSLEMQLDCIKGVSEGMIRQFLVRFGGELKEFQTFFDKDKPREKKKTP